MISVPVAISILLIVDSLHFVFARLLLNYISPSVSPMFVLLIGTIEVGIFGIVTNQLNIASFKSNYKFFLAIGILIAISTNMNYEAVTFIDPGTASLLGQTGKIWGLGFGIFWLRERLNRKQIVGAAIAFIGLFIITNQGGDYYQFGSLLILIATFFYAIHTAITKKFGDEIDFVNFFFYRLLSTTLFLFLFASARRTLAWPSKTAWLFLLMVGTVDVSLSRSVYYLTLRKLSLSIHTLVLTLTPVATVIWSLILFDVIPSSQQLFGGVIIILGILIVSTRKDDMD